MTTTFSSNTFENDYILAVLEHYQFDLTTAGKDVTREAQITDKYAVELTAFMNGQIVQAVKAAIKDKP
jgi:hypothetical protein